MKHGSKFKVKPYDVGLKSSLLKQRLPYLEDLLDRSGSLIVFFSNHIGVQDTRVGIQRIYSWVDTQLSNAAGQHSGGVKMGKCGGRGRISQIVSRYENGLKQ